MRYTTTGSEVFEAKVDQDMKLIVKTLAYSSIGTHLQAIILIGGYGRGEGTPFATHEGQVPFNDYDLFVISTASPQTVKPILHHLEELLSKKVGIPVDLAYIQEKKLAEMEFSLMNTEMRHGHRVLFGNKHILDQMPPFSIQALPKTEGTRLLMNRGYLLWENDRALESGDIDPRQIKKYIWKNHLAYGDCILLAFGDYAIGYQEKRDLIEKYRSDGSIPDVQRTIDEYKQAIEFKLTGNERLWPQGNLHELQKNAKKQFHTFFLWYEGRRLKHKLASTEKYREVLGREGSPDYPKWKAALLNLYYLKTQAFDWGWRWLLSYPRNRIFVELLLQLEQRGTWSPEQFRTLRERFS